MYILTDLKKIELNLDIVKALLICTVVLDHNDFVRSLFPNYFRSLNFHVVGFLSLAFLTIPNPLNTKFVMDRIARYMVPFFFYSIPAFIIYTIVFLDFTDFSNSFYSFILGSVTGDSNLLERSTGFSMLWFLPTLLGAVVLHSFTFHLSLIKKQLVFIFLILMHFFVGMISKDYLQFLPFGISVLLYTFLLSHLINIFRNNCNKLLLYLWPITFFTASYLSATLNTSTEVGFNKVESILNLNILILHDIMAVAGVLTVFIISTKFEKNLLLIKIGQNSLLIYLTHPFIYFILKNIISYFKINPNSEITTLLFVIITLAIALFISLFISLFIKNNNFLNTLITPGYLTDLTSLVKK